jgi:hypothetical protein
MTDLVDILIEHHPGSFPSPYCTCGFDLSGDPWGKLPFPEAHARHVANVLDAERRVDCGGCQGKGAHSPRCHQQPGWLWRRLYARADSLGDAIGPNDIEAANLAYSLAARLKQNWSAS